MEEKNLPVDEEEVIDDEEDLDLDDFEDEEPEEDVDNDQGEEPKKPEEAPKKEQSREERSRQAQMRREREAKERAKREKEIEEKAYLKGQLDSAKVNTFTNTKIEDEYDLKIFKLQQKIEEDGGDPIADLPSRLAQLEREEASKRKQEKDAETEVNEAINNDIKDFRTKYPDVDLQKLLLDPDFKDYSDGRLGIKGGKSLAEIYEAFDRFKSKYAPAKEKEEESGKTPAPSPNGGRKQQDTSYSKLSEEDKIKELRRQGLIN